MNLRATPEGIHGASLILVFLYWIYIELVTTHAMPSARVMLKNYIIFLSVPLGLYWWLTEGLGALFEAFRSWIRNRTEKVS